MQSGSPGGETFTKEARKKISLRLQNLTMLFFLIISYPFYKFLIALSDQYYLFQKPWDFLISIPDKAFTAPAFFFSLGFAGILATFIVSRKTKLHPKLEYITFSISLIIALVMNSYLLWLHSSLLGENIHINELGTISTKKYKIDQMVNISESKFSVNLAGTPRTRTVYNIEFSDGYIWKIEDDNKGIDSFIIILRKKISTR